MTDDTPKPLDGDAGEPAVSALDLVDVLTLGELAQAEELSGTSINALTDTKNPVVPLLTALACVAKRRIVPGFTMNQAEALTGKGLNDVFAEIVRPAGTPTEPAVITAPMNGGNDPEG